MLLSKNKSEQRQIHVFPFTVQYIEYHHGSR